MFVVDASTSIDFPALGGKPGNFDRMLSFAGDLVRDIEADAGGVSAGNVRVGAVGFATDATVELAGPVSSAFADALDGANNATYVENALRTIPYSGNVSTSGVSFSRTDLGLNAARTGPFATFRAAAKPVQEGYDVNHVVILTDGRSRAPPELGSDGGGGEMESLIATELALYSADSINRWVFGVSQGTAAGWAPQTQVLLSLAERLCHLGHL